MNKKNLSKKETEEKLKVYVGIDVHIKSYAISYITSNGIYKRLVMPNNPDNIVRFLKSNFGGDSEINTVYEAGFSGFVLHRVLESAGIKNIVVNPGSVMISSHDKVKTDRRDATKLMEHLRAGLLKGIRIPTLEEEERRQLTRLRGQLITARVRVMNQIRRRLVHFGYFTTYTKVLQRKDVEDLATKLPNQGLRWSIELQCRLWSCIDAELKQLTYKLKEQADSCPFSAIYQQVPGIGKVSSRILANELGNMSQFSNEKQLFKFVGLTPTEHSSGERIRRGHISRQSNPELRKILVECAWVAIRNDQSLRSVYRKLAARIGPKRAIVAIARKLIGHIRAIFRKGEDYRLTPIVEKLAA